MPLARAMHHIIPVARVQTCGGQLMVGVMVVALSMLLMFRTTWQILWFVFIVAMGVVKYSVAILILVLVTCNPFTYRAFGWTPLSLVVGDRVYDKSMKIIDDYERKQQQRTERQNVYKRYGKEQARTTRI